MDLNMLIMNKKEVYNAAKIGNKFEGMAFMRIGLRYSYEKTPYC